MRALFLHDGLEHVRFFLSTVAFLASAFLVYTGAYQTRRWQRISGWTAILVCFTLCLTVLKPLMVDYFFGPFLAGVLVFFVSLFAGMTVAETFGRSVE